MSAGAGLAQAAGAAGTITEHFVATDPLPEAAKVVGSPLSEHTASTLSTGRISASRLARGDAHTQDGVACATRLAGLRPQTII